MAENNPPRLARLMELLDSRGPDSRDVASWLEEARHSGDTELLELAQVAIYTRRSTDRQIARHQQQLSRALCLFVLVAAITLFLVLFLR